MVRALLRFSADQVQEPITAEVILSEEVEMNILSAQIDERGGEILIEFEPESTSKVVEAFRKKGVEVRVDGFIDIDNEKCIHCGACFSLCPVDAIKIEDDHSIIFEEKLCVRCGACLDACPMTAISLVR
jgi:ferredoxin